MQIAGYGNTGYYGTSAARAYGGGTVPQTETAGAKSGSAATVVTLSDEALAASTEPDFAQIVSAARAALNSLLAEAERSSPLVDGRLALDMSGLSQRELHAIATTDDGLFTSEERKAAELEMERRFDLALSGPAAVSEITGDYRVLYKAAAAHLDSLSAEQKAEPWWEKARAAVDKALAALETDRGTPPGDIADDPVAPWLAARVKDSGEGEEETAKTLAENLRAILDKRYAAAHEAGRVPTFNANSPRGEFIDLREFDSRAVSAMALNREGLFSAEEVRAANAEMRVRANTVLSEGYKDAARSGDPTAFSRNIVAMYSSMTADERAAAGFSENLLNAALASYESTTRLMDIMAMGMNAMGGMGSWFAR